MDAEEGINEDALAVGITRPSTILGVPYGAVILNMLVSVEALALTENLAWLLIGIPVHAICYLITLKDPRTFELLTLWARTRLGTLLTSWWYWSASTYSPLTVRKRPKLIARWRAINRKKAGGKHEHF